MALRFPVYYKALGITAALFVAWSVTPVVIKSLTRTTFLEFQAPAYTALSYLRDLQEYWGLRTRSRDSLISAGIDLARLNAAYELRNQRLDAFEAEVEGLESLLGLPPLPDYRYENARVVRRDLNTWWQTLTIRKGRIHGIERGQAVIFRGGVVGRIEDVQTYTATVQLISNPAFRIAAHFEGDTRPVQFQGILHAPLSTPRGEVSNAPSDIRVSLTEPRRLVTSRLGGVFPDGITVGQVFRLEPSPDGLFQSGAVRLSPDLLSVREVAVLVPLAPESPRSTALDPRR
jgi:rod shape-determining protein MreC